MSRCFPYPPPGYVRIPVAVAEAESTAKLQKEREKTEKKKEKRNDKETSQQGETSKHAKHSHKKRKLEDVIKAGQDTKRDSKESVEQLEKSGLSEEHGAPCFVQTMRNSPESSQDSSKRRKVVLPSPSQAKNGNILRIKIKSNQDSQSALEKPSLEQTVQQMGSGSSLSISAQQKVNSGSRSEQKSLLGNQNVRSTSAQQKVNSGSRSEQKNLITETPSKTLQRVVPQSAAKVTTPVDRQLPVKAPVGRSDLSPMILGSVDPSPLSMTRRSVPSPAGVIGRSGPPPVKMMTQRVQHDPQLAKVVQKETGSAVCLPEAQQPRVLQKPKDLPVLKQQEPVTTSVPKEEPCFSGRNAEAVQVQDTKLSRSDRKKIRKSEKKEKRFRDLFVTWNPPALNEGVELCDQDWLFSSKRKSDAASLAQCRAIDGGVPIPPMAQQQPSLQPRATFLPDLHMYQLPYVVPF